MCAEVPCQCLQQQHWLAHICHPRSATCTLGTPVVGNCMEEKEKEGLLSVGDPAADAAIPGA